MNSNVYDYLKKQIGKEVDQLPSQITSWLRGVLTDVTHEGLVAEYVVRTDMTNPYGYLHGGMYALIMDDLMGATVHCLDTTTVYVSLNLTVDFLEAAKLAEVIIAKTHIIRHGRNIVNTECCIYNKQKKLLAKGSSNLAATNIIKQAFI